MNYFFRCMILNAIIVSCVAASENRAGSMEEHATKIDHEVELGKAILATMRAIYVGERHASSLFKRGINTDMLTRAAEVTTSFFKLISRPAQEEAMQQMHCWERFERPFPFVLEELATKRREEGAR